MSLPPASMLPLKITSVYQGRLGIKSLCSDLTSRALRMVPALFTNPYSLDTALVATRGSHPPFTLREPPTHKDLGVLKIYPYPIFKPELGQGAGVFWISTWTLQDLWCEGSSHVLNKPHFADVYEVWLYSRELSWNCVFNKRGKKWNYQFSFFKRHVFSCTLGPSVREMDAFAQCIIW